MEVVPMTHVAGHNTTGLGLERHSQDNDVTSSSDAKSLPASQASSYGESPISQAGVQRTTKEALQASDLFQQDAILATAKGADLDRSSPISANTTTNSAVPRITTNFPNAEASKTRDRALSHETKHGQKRTANGHIKTPSSSTITSPTSATGPRGHARQTSQVGELTAQLRARLSYAMVKVQHGWESRTIDEVETLATQQPSPMSVVTSPNRAFGSPRSAVSAPASALPRTIVPTTFVPTAATTVAPWPNGPTYHDHAYPAATQPSYAHSRTVSSVPTLAPPVDLHSHPRRMSRPHTLQPSLLSGFRQVSNLSASSASSNPHSPPQHYQESSNLHQTSQRATAMEKDAIETLLFMSSPGNSQTAGHYGYHNNPGSAQPGTPLRSGFGVNDQDDRNEKIEPRKKELWEQGNLKDDQSIDRVLDQMDERDDSSDDEDDARPPPKAPRSGTNGVGRGLIYA